MLERARATEASLCVAPQRGDVVGHVGRRRVVDADRAAPRPRATRCRPSGRAGTTTACEASGPAPPRATRGTPRRAREQRRVHGSRPDAPRRSRARRSPSTVVSSFSVPSATRGRRRRRARCVSMVMKPSSIPSGRLAHGGQPGGQEDRRVLVADAGRVPGADQHAPVGRPRVPPPRPAPAVPWPPRDSPSTSQVPAGISSTMSVDGGPVLAHQRHRAVLVHRHDRHRAGMADR